MRILAGILCVILVLFTVVQYNDPDFVFWGAIYGIGAVWTGFAALSPATLTWGGARAMMALCVAAALYGVVYFYPTTEGFWRQDVWWETETAREGMGMMIVLIALLVAGTFCLRRA